jgi:glycosyltransferase involved in cell wall biosynthesis
MVDVLFLSHDASRTGAPIALLRVLRWLRDNTDLTFDVLCKQGGQLVGQFAAVAPTRVLAWWRYAAVRYGGRLARRLSPGFLTRGRYRLVYSNTATNGDVLPLLSRSGSPVLTHVHEMSYLIRHVTGLDSFRQTVRCTSRFVAASEAVRAGLVNDFGIPADAVDVVYPCLPAEALPADGATRAEVRRQLSIPENAFVVVGCGSPHWWKGLDLLPQVAAQVRRLNPDLHAHFVWVGGSPRWPEVAWMHHDARVLGLGDRVHSLPDVPDPRRVFAAADVFALSSRVDSYPLVVLEAASVGLPTVCFAGAGGAPEFVESDAGLVVPYLDVGAMAAALVRLANEPEARRQLGRTAAQKAVTRHSIARSGEGVYRAIRRVLAGGGKRFEGSAAPEEPVRPAAGPPLPAGPAG